MYMQYPSKKRELEERYPPTCSSKCQERVDLACKSKGIDKKNMWISVSSPSENIPSTLKTKPSPFVMLDLIVTLVGLPSLIIVWSFAFASVVIPLNIVQYYHILDSIYERELSVYIPDSFNIQVFFWTNLAIASMFVGIAVYRSYSMVPSNVIMQSNLYQRKALTRQLVKKYSCLNLIFIS